MKTLQSKSVLIPLVAGILLAGCQTNPTQTDDSGGYTTGSSSTSTSDTNRTRAEGAIGGAVIGGLLGLAIGGDSKGALIGAAVGAGAGLIVGNEIAKRKQQYASEEDFLDAEIASAREYNATAVAYNNKLRRNIAQLDRDTQLLTSRYRAGLASRDDLVNERDNLKGEIASAKKVYGNLEKEYEIKVAILEEQKKKGANTPQVRALEAEVSQLKKNMDQLQSQSVQLAQIDDRLTL